MGLRVTTRSEADLVDLTSDGSRAMDTTSTAEDSDVIVRFVRLGHEMHYPLASDSSGRLRLLVPRNEWRFEAEFSDGSKQWMLWAASASEATSKQTRMAALGTYAAAEHKLKLPAT
jgi:hypothetical protein